MDKDEKDLLIHYVEQIRELDDELADSMAEQFALSWNQNGEVEHTAHEIINIMDKTFQTLDEPGRQKWLVLKAHFLDHFKLKS